MDASTLRIALFSGNYNYVKDGANQALNKLVAFLEQHGATVRVYSPTSDTPAFEPAGTLVSIPSVAIPGRKEYRFALGMPKSIEKDLDAFQPNIVHISAPDLACQQAVTYASKRGIKAVASVHTRFETYLKYYRLGWLEGWLSRTIARLYNRCAEIYIPTTCMADLLAPTGVTVPMKLWTRGIDLETFTPERRSNEWRQDHNISDSDVVIAFVGRIVLEKGLEVFADAIDLLKERNLKFKTLVVGDGPKKQWFQDRMPSAIFTGFQGGIDLARAYASADIFFNPSATETFGNVTLEGMACGLPQVCADASGSRFLVQDKETGYLAPHDDAIAYANALETLITDSDQRQKMRKASIKRAQEFHWDAVLGQVIDHYNRLLSE